MSYESRLSLTVDARSGEQSLKRFRGELDNTERAGRGAARSAEDFSGSLSNVKAMAIAAGGALSAIGLTQLTRNVFDTIRSTEKLQASLKTVTGSASDAADAWSTLVEFAKTTPFTLDQSVTGFIRMKSLGLDPTTEALTSFGNTASAMGKDLMQMIEAVADASTGEFERLKEFGIRARTQGDQITFIFQGVETTVRNSAQDITRYLESIGNAEFSGAMAEQMDTLDGQVSNLQDSVDDLFRTIGEAGVTDLFSSSIEAAANSTEWLTENLETVADAAVVAAGVFGARLFGGIAGATTAMIAGQIEAGRYQLALARMAGVSSTAAASQTALAAATRGASAAMAFLGGPVGALALAAGGLYYFRDELGLTTPEVTAAKGEVDKFVDSLDDLSESALRLEIATITQQLNELEREAKAAAESIQSAASSNDGMTNGILGISASSISEYSQNLQEGTAESRAIRTEIATLTEQLEAAQTRLEAMTKSTRDDTREKRENAIATREAAASAREWYQAQQSAYGELQTLLDKIDPVGAELRSLTADISVVQEAFSRGFITAEQADDIVNALNDPEHWEETGKKSAEAFINPWQSAADTVAQSLQDAIASGDWDDIGDAIGGALGSSIAAIVNKQVTDSLAKDLTANSSTLAQIGGAFAGPIAGAVAGGAIQLAVSELSDFFSGSDWDPTAARQAAQGTGTVLGSIDAKSESIRRAVEGSESGIGQLVGINHGMLRALQALQAGISGASTMVARGYGGLNFTASDQFSRTDMAGAGMLLGSSTFGLGSLGAIGGIGNALGPIGGLLTGGLVGQGIDFIDNLTGGLFSDIGSSIFGGSRKVKDLGIQFFGATLDEMIRGWRDGDRYLTAQAYASIEEDGGWFGSDDRWDDFQRLGPEAENQISLVFAGIRESVTAGAEALGMADGDINRALSRFRVATQKISLEDLSAEEQAAELEAVFSKIFDQAAGAVVPYLDDFQQAGEGLGETLSRVANQTLVTQEAVNRLGIQFSDLAGRDLVVASERLMDAAGGVEQFITSMQGFIGNFASEAQKFELAYSDITRALAQSNLQLPSTRDGYYDLLQAHNGATAAGAENIATLLRLQGVADQYYTMLEDSQRQLLEGQRDVISESLREAERASDAVARALRGISIDSVRSASISREAALSSLQAMAASGRVGSQDELTSALNAATNIRAGEFGTMNDYIRSVSRTGETLQNLKWVTDQQVTKEQRLLSNIERRIQAMNEEMSAIGAATAKHTAKTAKLLERIENNGVEVRQ